MDKVFCLLFWLRYQFTYSIFWPHHSRKSVSDARILMQVVSSRRSVCPALHGNFEPFNGLSPWRALYPVDSLLVPVNRPSLFCWIPVMVRSEPAESAANGAPSARY
ncbi:hypothetical protein AMECASPLE_006382 [Ameca splendens]|uniref:Secreted protein n=1 Tax=Ameca splendens TaxID=208324 RepID=A0ABV0XCG5_9TELE